MSSGRTVDEALAEVYAAYPGEDGKHHTTRVLADEVKRLRGRVVDLEYKVADLRDQVAALREPRRPRN